MSPLQLLTSKSNSQEIFLERHTYITLLLFSKNHLFMFFVVIFVVVCFCFDLLTICAILNVLLKTFFKLFYFYIYRLFH